jgi:hypothetical protein
MFKKILMITLLIGAVGALVFGAILRTDANSRTVEAASGLGNGNGRGGNGQRGNAQGSQNGAVAHNEDLSALPLASSATLSSAESDALAYMREEEKLAHDVYNFLYENWGLPIFQNIATSEQTHTDAVKTLLDRYNLADPASNQARVFTNSTLQDLYTSLVERGSQSLEEALRVGAAIEEIDILDLQQALTQTSSADIQTTFNNLLSGSNHHLRSFIAQLKTQVGVEYTSQYLSPESYQESIANTSGNGGGQGYRGGRR